MGPSFDLSYYLGTYEYVLKYVSISSSRGGIVQSLKELGTGFTSEVRQGNILKMCVFLSLEDKDFMTVASSLYCLYPK
jgi:hypothetical protein